MDDSSKTVVSCVSPCWANVEHTAIDAIVKFAELNTAVPFSARCDDVEEYGRRLFRAIARGDYGQIANYKAPPVAARSATKNGPRVLA